MTYWDLEHARHPVDRAEAHRLLDELLDLRERTDPATCTDPDTVSPLNREPPFDDVDHEGRTCTVEAVLRGKEHCADRALGLATTLFIQCAGWAMNHEVGKSQYEQINNKNHHAFEKTAYENGGFGYVDSPTVERKLIRRLLGFTYLGRMLPKSFERLAIALEALDFGEVHEIAEPINTGRHHRPYTLAKLRMQAVQHVHFLKGKGLPIKRGQDIVSEAFGVSPHTLRSWETRLLVDAFGKDEVEGSTNFAREAGEHLVHSSSDPHYGMTDKGRPPINGYAQISAPLFDLVDINELGTEYRRILRESKGADEP